MIVPTAERPSCKPEKKRRGQFERAHDAHAGDHRCFHLSAPDNKLIRDPPLRGLGRQDRGPLGDARCRSSADARQAYTIREPIGVIGAITAWNAPTLIASWKLGPALAAGNAVVLKPAEDAPLTSLHLATLIEEVGFPAGVVNVVPGLGETRRRRARAPPAASTRSASPAAPRSAARSRSRRRSDFQRVTLELGGKSPQIVLGDADLEAVLPGLASRLPRQPGRDLRGRHAHPRRARALRRRRRGPRRRRARRAPRRPVRPEHDDGRADQRASSATASPATSRRARPRAPSSSPAAARPTARASSWSRRSSPAASNRIAIAQDEIFGPVGARAPVRRRRRGDRDRQRHPLRARRLRLDDEPRPGPPLRRAGRPAASGSTAPRRPTRACPGAA